MSRGAGGVRGYGGGARYGGASEVAPAGAVNALRRPSTSEINDPGGGPPPRESALPNRGVAGYTTRTPALPRGTPRGSQPERPEEDDKAADGQGNDPTGQGRGPDLRHDARPHGPSDHDHSHGHPRVGGRGAAPRDGDAGTPDSRGQAPPGDRVDGRASGSRRSTSRWTTARSTPACAPRSGAPARSWTCAGCSPSTATAACCRS